MGNGSCQSVCKDVKQDQNQLFSDPNKNSKQTNQDKVDQIEPIQFDDPDQITEEPNSMKVNQFKTTHSNFTNQPTQNQPATDRVTKLSQIQEAQVQDGQAQAPSASQLVVVKTSKFTRDINFEQYSKYKRMNVPFEVIHMGLSSVLHDKISKIDKTFLQKNLNTKTNAAKNWYLLQQGCYANFIKEDKFGIFIASDKFYHGNFKSILQGNIKVYVPEGQGIYVTQDLIYNGNFVEGLAFGKGRYTSQNAVYEGQWENGTLIKGTINHKIYTFTGQFKNSKPDGKGKITFKLSNTTYEGNFVQGKFDDTEGDYKCLQYTYKGGFKKGRKNGYGVLIEKQKQGSNSKKYKPPLTLRGQWEDDEFIVKSDSQN